LGTETEMIMKSVEEFRCSSPPMKFFYSCEIIHLENSI